MMGFIFLGIQLMAMAAQAACPNLSGTYLLPGGGPSCYRFYNGDVTGSYPIFPASPSHPNFEQYPNIYGDPSYEPLDFILEIEQHGCKQARIRLRPVNRWVNPFDDKINYSWINDPVEISQAISWQGSNMVFQNSHKPGENCRNQLYWGTSTTYRECGPKLLELQTWSFGKTPTGKLMMVISGEENLRESCTFTSTKDLPQEAPAYRIDDKLVPRFPLSVRRKGYPLGNIALMSTEPLSATIDQEKMIKDDRLNWLLSTPMQVSDRFYYRSLYFTGPDQAFEIRDSENKRVFFQRLSKPAGEPSGWRESIVDIAALKAQGILKPGKDYVVIQYTFVRENETPVEPRERSRYEQVYAIRLMHVN